MLTREENPRSKCWKVTVPYKFKEVMEKGELYHAGWTHRKFFGARNGKGKQKQLRLEDPVERELEEQRRLQQGGEQPNLGADLAGQDGKVNFDAIMHERPASQGGDGSVGSSGIAAAH